MAIWRNEVKIRKEGRKIRIKETKKERKEREEKKRPRRKRKIVNKISRRNRKRCKVAVGRHFCLQHVKTKQQRRRG